MTDIVERLLDRANHDDWVVRAEAADVIKRMQAELARIRGLPRLAALDAEIERLAADLAVTAANLNIAKANLHSERIIIERLTAWLQEIAREQSATDADYFQAIARAALAGQPLAASRALEPKP